MTRFGFMGGCRIVAGGSTVGSAEIDVYAGNAFFAYPVEVVQAPSRPALPNPPAPIARDLARRARKSRYIEVVARVKVRSRRGNTSVLARSYG